MGSLSVAFHFVATLLVAVAAAGAAWAAVIRPSAAPRNPVARLAFAAGWATLGASEVLHGFLVFEADQDLVGAGLRALGFLLVLAGLTGRAEGAWYALVPAVVPVSAAGVFALGAGGLALRSGVPAARRLAGGLLALALAEGALAPFGPPDPTPDLAFLAAHALRVAGAVLIGAWLWRALLSSIQVRFVSAFVALLLFVVVTIAGAITQVFVVNVRRSALEEAELEAIRAAATMAEGVQESYVRAGVVADALQAQVAGRSPELADLAREIRVRLDADFLFFLDPDRTILAFSVQERESVPVLDEAENLSLAGTQVVADAVGGTAGGSIEAIGAGEVAMIGAAPVKNPSGGAPAGAVAIGRVVDRVFVEPLATKTQDVSVLTQAGVIASTLPEPGQIFEAAGDEVRRTVFEQRRPLRAVVRVGGSDYFTAFTPLEGSNGVALAISRPSEVVAGTQESLTRILFGLALAATALAVAASSVSGSRITRPIRDLTAAAERVRQGDLQAHVGVGTPDEVGALAATFNEMTVSLGRLTGDLRRSAEEEYRLRSELETVLQSMTDGVVAVDSAGRVVAINREAERIFGTSAGEAIGRDVHAVIRARDASGSALSPTIYLLEEGAVTGFVGDPRNDGEMPVAITSAPIRSDRGLVTGAVAVVRDLTQEYEVERMKTEFLSNISHELRTPLTPIKGYADLMRRKQVPRAKAVTFLDGILASTERLERIVEMLVDFSAMKAGRLIPRRAPLDLDAVTAAHIERWTAAAPRHRFERRDFSRLPLLNVDERLLPRAINELIDNAVKFSPEGRVVLSAKTGPENGTVRISVADEGIGIAEGEQERIFQDFVQVDASETRPYGGLGLGLAYVRRIVEGHGGRLELESTPGKGSTFTLVLPGAMAGPAPPGGETPPPEVSGPSPRPRRPSAGSPGTGARTGQRRGRPGKDAPDRRGRGR